MSCGQRYIPNYKRKGDERSNGYLCSDCYSPELLQEADRVYSNNQRAKAIGLDGNLTLAQWLKTVMDFGGKCIYCGKEYTDIEHFMPLSLGFGTSADNCVPSCNSCNAKKHNRNPLKARKLFKYQYTAKDIQKYLSGR